MSKFFFILIVALFIAFPSHSFAGWFVYDDFNGDSINDDKWLVSQTNITAGNGPFLLSGSVRIDLGNGQTASNSIHAKQVDTDTRGVRVTLALPEGSSEYMDWMIRNVTFFVRINLPEYNNSAAPYFHVNYSLNGDKSVQGGYIEKYGVAVNLLENLEWVTYFDVSFKPENNQAVFEIMYDNSKALAKIGSRGAMLYTDGFGDISSAFAAYRVEIGLRNYNPDANNLSTLGSITIDKVEMFSGIPIIPGINSLLLN